MSQKRLTLQRARKRSDGLLSTLVASFVDFLDVFDKDIAEYGYFRTRVPFLATRACALERGAVYGSFTLHGTGNDGFMYFAICRSHYTGTGTGTGNGNGDHWVPYPFSRSLSRFLSRSRAV